MDPPARSWSDAERSEAEGRTPRSGDGVASDPERGTPSGSRRAFGSPSEGVFSYDAWRLLGLIVGVCGLVIAAMYAFT